MTLEPHQEFEVEYVSAVRQEPETGKIQVRTRKVFVRDKREEGEPSDWKPKEPSQ